MKQQILPFAHPASYEKEDFVLSECNQTAFKQIDSWPDWRTLLLVGPAGSGKTHLGHIWARKAGALLIDCKQTKLMPDKIKTHCLIDNAEHADEEALFHLVNIAKEQELSLLICLSTAPKQLGITLPDLSSRLLAMPVAHIDPPDDALLIGVMQKLLADRQLHASDDTLHYALARMERSFAATESFIRSLDDALWQQKKSLTIPFIRSVLASDCEGEPGK